jgi:hypothetical protein
MYHDLRWERSKVQLFPLRRKLSKALFTYEGIVLAIPLNHRLRKMVI